MRFLVLGSLVPQTARTVWRLIAAGHEIEEIWIGENSSGVWQRRDRRLGRWAPTWSVGAAARRCSIPLRRVASFRRDRTLLQLIVRPRVDALLACCFPYKVPSAALASYGGRAFNLHPSLLPRYRGPCPMPALVFDEALDASGVTLHAMTARFDEGEILAQSPAPWPEDGWYRSWEADLADASGRLAVDVLPRWRAGAVDAKPQAGPATYVRSLPADGLVIHPGIDARRARWLANSLGRVLPLAPGSAGVSVGLGPVVASWGAPSGLAPRVHWNRVDCDVSDARLQFVRWTSWHRRAERWRHLVALARRPLAA